MTDLELACLVDEMDKGTPMRADVFQKLHADWVMAVLAVKGPVTWVWPIWMELLSKMCAQVSSSGEAQPSPPSSMARACPTPSALLKEMEAFLAYAHALRIESFLWVYMDLVLPAMEDTPGLIWRIMAPDAFLGQGQRVQHGVFWNMNLTQLERLWHHMIPSEWFPKPPNCLQVYVTYEHVLPPCEATTRKRMGQCLWVAKNIRTLGIGVRTNEGPVGSYADLLSYVKSHEYKVLVVVGDEGDDDTKKMHVRDIVHCQNHSMTLAQLLQWMK